MPYLTLTENLKLQLSPGLVASYDIQPGNGVGPEPSIHLDHIGPLPVSPEGYHHLLVVIDTTTLWTEAFPVKSTTAEERRL